MTAGRRAVNPAVARLLLRRVALLALLLAPDTAAAALLWTRGDASLHLSGSLRELLTVSSETDGPTFVNAFASDSKCFFPVSFADCSAFADRGEKTAVRSATRLRTRFDLRLSPGLSAYASYDHELSLGHLDTLEVQLARGFSQDTFLRAEDDIVSSRRVAWHHRLYRGAIRLESEHFEVVIGRQRIAWGVGRLWNPIDRLNAVGPLALEPDLSLGIDALDLKWMIGGFHFVEFVYAPGRGDPDRQLALRAHAVVLDTDLSLMAGVLDRAPTAGVEIARNLGEAALRFEVVYTAPKHPVHPVDAAVAEAPDPYWQVLGSIDRNFDIGSGVYLLVEHLYNGNALGFGHGQAGSLLPFFERTASGSVVPATAAIAGTSQVVSGAHHQTGVMIGTDLWPELRAEMVTIYDWNGASAVFFPSLRYSPVGSIEVLLGAQMGVGPRLSEFGPMGEVGFVRLEVFF